MAQTTFEFPPAAENAVPAGALRCAATPGAAQPAEAGAIDRTGFAIGWDHAHHRLTPPLGHLDDHSPVRQGWAAGRAAFGARTLRPTAAVRQWLALRLQAWQQGQPFEEVQVNPSFLARIDADECPVRRTPLLLCSGTDDDATVARLNGRAAYAAGNLAVVSAPAAAALSASDWAQALANADRLADGVASPIAGLDQAAWLRLAVLASFATPLPHGHAALLPLRVLPPNRVRVINPVQALQVVLTLQFSAAGYARRLLGLAALMPSSEVRQAFQIFMHTLLARRLAVGPAPTPAELRRALEDSWADPLVNRRWQRLALRLGAADCERLLQRAASRQLVVGGSRWLSAETATEGWAMADGPRATRPGLPERPDQAACSASAARPGSIRSRGSQKLAS